MTTPQLTMNFLPGLTAQFPRFRDVLVTAVYGSRKGLNGVAEDLDQSPSDLTKRLSSEHGDPRPMREEDILGIIESTQDVRPIYWLIEKYLQSPEAQKAQAIAQLAEALPSILALVDAVTAGENKKGRHK